MEKSGMSLGQLIAAAATWQRNRGFWHRNGQLGLLRAQVIVLVWLIANLRGHGVSMRLVPFVFYRYDGFLLDAAHGSGQFCCSRFRLSTCGYDILVALHRCTALQ
uniref:Uncharacterized protein n=1 Tax=Physcomitrium patens TaxID=3218 RepID=A0A2K1IHG7_PHYPA|nr:hypothetical protein PHYPA_029319 [Physcomitrium patens]